VRKFLVHLIAAFIPDSAKRKAFRNKYIYSSEFKILHNIDENLSKTTNNLARKMTLIKNDDVWTLQNGIKLYCPLYPWDFIQEIIVNTDNFFEYSILTQLRKYIPKGAIILDIGANIGNHSIFWGSAAAKIHSFEPIRESYRMLCKNIELNRLSEVITPHNIALGDESSFGEILKAKAINIGATEVQSTLQGDRYSFRIERLDDIELGVERIDFVKIDVERYELKTLAGMRKTLEKYRPAVFIESFEVNTTKVVEFFNELGYIEPIAFIDSNWLFLPA
jgi:FkbM family methyltransferase